MGLRFDPVGGGQFKAAVNAIIEAESQPLKPMNARKAKEDARLKLFQDFKSKFNTLEKSINEMSTFRKFRELKVDLGEGSELASVTIDKDRAEAGQYQIEIEELANRSSMISNGFDDADEAKFGAGFVSLTYGDGQTAEIYVEDKDSSLRGIAATINKDEKSPIRAAVVKDSSDPDAPWKLIIKGKTDGKANQIENVEFYFSDTQEDLYVDDDKEATNASISVDGFPIELASNDANDFLPGVNLHLKHAKPGSPFTLTITQDYQKIAGKVKGLIDNINGVLSFITKQNTVDEHTDTTTTFAGDASLQNVEFQVRNLIHQGFPVRNPETGEVKIVQIGEVGIEFDKTGQLSFKEDKFKKLVEKDFDNLAQAISGENGFVSALRDIVTPYTRPGNGFLNNKEQGIRQRIKDIDNQIENKNRLIEQKKQAVVEKFARLESTIGNMQKQQQYLSAALPGGGGGGLMSLLG